MGRLGSWANTEKRVWADYEQLFRVIFSCLGGQKKFQNFFKKYFSNRTEKLLKMAFIIFFLLLLKKCEKVEKTGFFRANTQISNLNVLHKGLLMQDWVFRLG